MSASGMLLRQRTVALLTLARQRAARVGVLEQIRDRVADEHLVPDADAHRRAFLGVHRLAAQVVLVEAQIEDVALAEPVHDAAPSGPSLASRKCKPGSSSIAEHLAEQHVDVAAAVPRRWCRNRTARTRPRTIGTTMKQADEGGDKAAMTKFNHDFTSRMTLLGLAEELQPHVAQVGGSAPGAALLQLGQLRRPARVSGSTSAWALSVSISTARLDCTIFWSADGLREADVGRDLVVRGVDRGQRATRPPAAGRCR